MSSLSGTALTEAARSQQLQIYGLLICTAILIFDWVLVLQDELAFVWDGSWSLIKFLYIITRLTPCIDVALCLRFGLLLHMKPELIPRTCHTLAAAFTYTMGIGLSLSELILVWRTYILWNCSRRLLIVLLSLWTLLLPVTIWFLMSFTTSFTYLALPTNVRGCHSLANKPLLVGEAFAAVFVTEFLVVVLTIIKGISHVRFMRRGALIKTLYRDGVIFFVNLCVVSAICIVIVRVKKPHSTSLPVNLFLRVTHSTMCCRVVLHLRTAATQSLRAESDADEPYGSFTTFYRTIVGSPPREGPECPAPSSNEQYMLTELPSMAAVLDIRRHPANV